MIPINIKSLINHLSNPIDAYHDLGIGFDPDNQDSRFIDNGSEILGVAHLDYIDLRVPPKYHLESNTIYSSALDDRLGVYCLLDHLPKTGLKFDVLLTRDEEICQSTALVFDPPKSYKWMFSLDRAGADVVCYHYYHTDLRRYLSKFGYTDLGIGSYSDIVDLDHLKITGLNFGIGYQMQHTIHCYANLYFVQYCIERFTNFFLRNNKCNLPYKVSNNYRYNYIEGEYITKYDGDIWQKESTQSKSKSNVKYLDDYDDYFECIYCGRILDSEIDDIDDFLAAGELCTDCKSDFYGGSSKM